MSETRWTAETEELVASRGAGSLDQALDVLVCVAARAQTLHTRREAGHVG